ncbi:hypothetical protein FNF27_03894 [Cafeteria roenbergensis]|nr:hypothetical protein FNF29_01607 [Cafeteria roenbergensis]KAA0163766.1 hypothetical protein FNF31_02620 [Cafeteria roenbergensis]KAA0171342.1 hypothetical protein FNF28_00833 [Cafeteria roenbergensis]KAA0174520.1 hypothetical protein FNF27_03894 [Cafeteria roenbergensis]|eukprot:KAA0155692.1 hypothetical protein FNF29_01607 [Cafeteria roenbergensis]
MAVYRDFPEMGIKKQPFIEKNEIRRETTFYKWKPGTDNYFSVLMLVGVIPALLYVGNRSDLVTKATKKRGSKTAQQDYL